MTIWKDEFQFCWGEIDMGNHWGTEVTDCIAAPIYRALSYLSLGKIKFRVFSINRDAQTLTIEWKNADDGT